MASEISRPPVEIPDGITFGDKVVRLPCISKIFEGALCRPGCLPELPTTPYPALTWINRGDCLIELMAFTPKAGIPFIDFFLDMNVEKICIYSPVSGLLIHNQCEYADQGSGFDNTSLLIPDDEPPAEDGTYMFSRLRAFFFEHEKHIKGRVNGQSLSEAINEQTSRTCEYIDAMPGFEGYFQEARTRHPNIRPLLKHLL